MKEGYRNAEAEIKPGEDILMIARNTIAGRGLAEVEASMRKTFAKSGIIQ
jgi:RNase P protein component